MTITLNTICADTFDHIETGFTLEVLRTLMRIGPLEFMRFKSERGAWVEMLRDGSLCAPRDPDGIDSVEEVPGTDYASWVTADDADIIPDLPWLMLPGEGWDLEALHREPSIVRLLSHFPNRSVHRIEPIAEVHYDPADSEDGAFMLHAGSLQNLVLIFG